MASTVTFKAVIQQGREAARGIVPCVQRATFDPTAAVADTTIVLPKGAVLMGIFLDGGATGGASPTVDVGTSADTDGYLNEADADGAAFYNIGSTEAGALWDMAVETTDTTIQAGVGASAATGGTVTMDVWYFTVPASSKDPSSE